MNSPLLACPQSREPFSHIYLRRLCLLKLHVFRAWQTFMSIKYDFSISLPEFHREIDIFCRFFHANCGMRVFQISIKGDEVVCKSRNLRK